jgi:hypothetical protein
MSRAELEYVLDVLWRNKRMLELIGPSTEHPEVALRQIQALAKAAEDLKRPRFSLNPFV